MSRRVTHNLQLHSLVSDYDGSELEIDADRRYIALGGGVVLPKTRASVMRRVRCVPSVAPRHTCTYRESKQQLGFAYA